MMTRKAAIIWFIAIIFALAGGTLLLAGNRNISRYSYLPMPGQGQLTGHGYYSLSYNEMHEQPEWVAYKIIPSRIDDQAERTDRFRADESIETGTATDTDYTRSGYDRGHMAPAADMSFSKTAMDESFYYSNISPQLPGFNRGIWKKLEDEIREGAPRYDSLLVVTGPVFSEGVIKIGSNGVTIPSGFYKITLMFSGNKIDHAAWLFPHLEGLKETEGYIVSIDSIESATGIDFFHDLPQRMENRIERNPVREVRQGGLVGARKENR
ncbi:MAG: DNA/RNA non-specific endonuclease [Bacteroidales bacterium]|nr:DNA/RNA non-specific endonuclease [Bacteroidales bacterium]